MSLHKIYVGNISYRTTEDDLRAEFESCGPVTDAHVVMDRETGRSRGFAFVTFETEEALEKAYEKDNTEVEGRTIRVRKAEEKPRRV